jgi:hypothetical protein
MDDADRFDRVLGVGAQAFLDGRRVGAVTPVGRLQLRHQTETLGHLIPQARELPRLDH